MKYLLILLPAFFWASSDVLTRISSDKVNSFWGSFLLSLGMAIALGIVLLFMPNAFRELGKTPTNYIWLVLGSGVVNAVAWYFYFQFLQSGGNFTQGMPIMLVLLSIFIVIYGIVFFKDPINTKILIGLLCAGGAIYFLS